MTVRPRAAALRGRLTPKVLYLLFAAALGFLGALWATRQLAPGAGLAPLPSLVDCLRDTDGRLGTAPSGLDRIRQVAGLCGQQIQLQSTLDDVEARRLAAVQRSLSNPVLLGMVVVVTLAGVALAGVQLLAAFDLAAASGPALAGDGELVVQKGRIALKASATGLAILAMSFAFFLAFVLSLPRGAPAEGERPAEAGPALPPPPPAPPAAPPAAPNDPAPAAAPARHPARHPPGAHHAAEGERRRCRLAAGPRGDAVC